MLQELIGFIEFEKDLRSISNVPTNYPVNLTRSINYNMILKDFDPEIYNFRTMINYTYIVPSTAQGSVSAIDQDIEINLKVYAENKKTKESIGYFECTKLYYNVTRKEIESPILLEIILNTKYYIILNKQGIFQNIEFLETKVNPEQFPPTYWGLFFN